jgi:hypothetical protein
VSGRSDRQHGQRRHTERDRQHERGDDEPHGRLVPHRRVTPQERTAAPSDRLPPRVHGRPTLVTLVGDEPLAPLVLARHLDAGRVICIGLPVVDWRVEPLLQILRRHRCVPGWMSLSVLDVPAGVREIEGRLNLAADETVVFDLTNARGVLGIALYELAHRREQAGPDRTRLLRVDWSDRVIRAVSPDAAQAEPLRTTIGLADYLGVHGKQLLGQERATGSVSPFGKAAWRLARAIPQARPLLDAVHRGSVERPLRIQQRRNSARLVEELIEDGVLERRGPAIYATSMQAFQFLHGRWLEEYLFEIADASGQFDDCASGVRFRWTFAGEEQRRNGEDVANEIDFAGTSGGRATIASCKTGGRDVNGPLYELLTLAERAAGRSVVTVFATTDTLDRAARHRAAALGVRVADATRLPDPHTVLQLLLTGAPPAGNGVARLASQAERAGHRPARRAATRRRAAGGTALDDVPHLTDVSDVSGPDATEEASRA